MNNMAESAPKTYQIQVISKRYYVLYLIDRRADTSRYITQTVLDKYVNGKLEEFGSDWSRTVTWSRHPVQIVDVLMIIAVRERPPNRIHSMAQLNRCMVTFGPEVVA